MLTDTAFDTNPEPTEAPTDMDATAENTEAPLPEPMHPDQHIGSALQLLDDAQAAAARIDDEDDEMTMMGSLLAANAHATIGLYELMRRAAASEDLISPDVRGAN